MSLPAAADLSGLASLARDPRLDLRPVVLRVQTDLFLAAPARDAAVIASFEALACGLLPAVDGVAAAKIARRLARCADAPDAVLEALVAHGGEARYAVIRGAARLAPSLREAALADPDVACALAGRADLDADTAVRLSELRDDGVDFALAMNRAIELPAFARDELIARAAERAALAQALLSRDDLSAPEEAALYVHADAARRGRIRARLEPFAILRRALGATLGDAEVAELLAAADDGRTTFDARLADLLGVSPTPAWRFEHPSRHELLAIALAALGAPSETIVRLLLTVEPSIARSVPTVFALAALTRELEQPLAATLLEAFLGAAIPPRRVGRHVPAADPSTSPARAGEARRERARIDEVVRRAG